jgi:uncharacterized protein
MLKNMNNLYISRYNLDFEIKCNGKKEYILFNPLSGAIDIVKKEVIDGLKKLKNSNKQKIFDDDTIAELIKRGYIFNNENEEKEKLLHYHGKYKKYISKAPLVFILIPTYNCNLNCTYCFEGKEKKSGLISDAVLDRMLKTMSEIVQENPTHSRPQVMLFGGEPLLKSKKQEKVVEKILNECKEKGYYLRILTNGVNLKYYSKMIKKYSPDALQISLDGPKEIHDKRRVFSDGRGSFDKIVEGIDEIIGSKTKVYIRINVDTENIDYLPELADFIIEKKWHKKEGTVIYSSAVTDFSCTGYSKNTIPKELLLKKILDMTKKYEQLKILNFETWTDLWNILYPIIFKKSFPFSPTFNHCGAYDNNFSFDLNGNIYTCGAYSGRKDFQIGCFYPKIIYDKKEFNKWRNRNILNIEKCSKCKYSLLCGGGCSARALFLNKDFYNPACEPIQEMLQIAFEYYYPQLKKLSEELS